MFKNYLKIAFRNIKKHKGYSLINILGLAIGMTICILILLFVHYELSYDTYHKHADRIYRIERVWLSADGSIKGHLCSVAPSFVPFLEQEFPEVENAARMYDAGNIRISLDESCSQPHQRIFGPY